MCAFNEALFSAFGPIIQASRCRVERLQSVSIFLTGKARRLIKFQTLNHSLNNILDKGTIRLTPFRRADLTQRTILPGDCKSTPRTHTACRMACLINPMLCVMSL